MVTIIKYVFYALLIVTIYYVAVGFYEGRITKDSSLSEVGSHVASNTKEIMQSGYEKTKDAVQGGIETLSNEAEQETDKTVREVENEAQGIVDAIK